LARLLADLLGLEIGPQIPDYAQSKSRLVAIPTLLPEGFVKRLESRPPQLRDTASVLAETPAHGRANIVPLRPTAAKE
jgi:hypothetical protein